ncbi:hypothetical protein LCGC14_0726880 [marine sediment metagenome]|uniref:Uncharacterized protein n=1 Tax=marine sediment metagenome TaxID=412755 RepID=A0A0F9QEX3_9ZZZZ
MTSGLEPTAGIHADRALVAHLENAGSRDMNVDGTTPVTFEYGPPAGLVAAIERCLIHLFDSTIDPSDFGGIRPALTNGLLVQLIEPDDSVGLDFLDGETINNNGEFSLLAGVDVVFESGVGDDQIYVRWTLALDHGAPLLLRTGDRFRVTVRDDIQAISSFRWALKGRLIRIA